VGEDVSWLIDGGGIRSTQRVGFATQPGQIGGREGGKGVRCGNSRCKFQTQRWETLVGLKPDNKEKGPEKCMECCRIAGVMGNVRR
jgi:hypothetical protein